MANLKQINELKAQLAAKDAELREKDREVENIRRIAEVAITAMTNMLGDLLPKHKHIRITADNWMVVNGASLHIEEPEQYEGYVKDTDGNPQTIPSSTINMALFNIPETPADE